MNRNTLSSLKALSLKDRFYFTGQTTREVFEIVEGIRKLQEGSKVVWFCPAAIIDTNHPNKQNFYRYSKHDKEIVFLRNNEKEATNG